jgi:spermidine/putrescine transport system permease protein
MNRRHPFLVAHSALVYVFLYAPILVLVVFSFNKAKQTAVWKGFTLDWFGRMLHNRQIVDALANSLIVALVATSVATVIGTLAALALSRYEFRGKALTRGLLYLPIVIPEIVLGVSLLSFFGLLKVSGSLWTISIAHIAFSISYVTVVVRARLAGFDRSLEEAARDLGATSLGVFFRVTLPLMLPGIAAGGLLVFTLSIDDYVITSLVAGPGSSTLPMVIYSMLKTSPTPEVNAVSSLLLAFTIIMIVVAQWLMRDSSNKDRRS